MIIQKNFYLSLRILSDNYYMAKGTLKISKPSDKVPSKLVISKSKLRQMVRPKVIKMDPLRRRWETVEKRLHRLIDEENLTCSVCLQLLIQPVLAECGHAFCRPCAELLTMNKYCCSICHSHHPSYDLPASHKLQRLVSMHLENRQEDRNLYNIRKRQLLEKQQDRSPGVLKEGLFIDFWDQAELVWKTGEIEEVNEQEAKIKDTKTGVLFIINLSSRRISKLHYFTKKDAPEEQPNFEGPRFLGGLSLFGRNPFFSSMRTQQRLGGYFPLMYYLGGGPTQPMQVSAPWNFSYQPPGF